MKTLITTLIVLFVFISSGHAQEIEHENHPFIGMVKVTLNVTNPAKIKITVRAMDGSAPVIIFSGTINPEEKNIYLGLEKALIYEIKIYADKKLIRVITVPSFGTPRTIACGVFYLLKK